MSLTELALAMRQSFLDGKRVEGVCEGNAEPETLNYRRREEAICSRVDQR